MGIHCLDRAAVLDGHVSVEDAETLLAHLRTLARPAVDLSDCEHVHAAVLQVLLAVRPVLLAPPRDARLAGVLCTLHSEEP